MKRFYSHYTYIHPDIYLKNVIVELDDQYQIATVTPFEKEIANTEFYSGWLLLIPQNETKAIVASLHLNKVSEYNSPNEFDHKVSYSIYNMEGDRIL